MTNYEKLCEAAGIGNDWRYLIVEQKHKEHLFNKKDFIEFLKRKKSYTLLFCKRENEIFLNSFTAEKQIELIKLIGDMGNICMVKRHFNGLWCFTTHYKNGFCENADFAEALAGLVLQLIEAGELNKEAVRKVFE